jgi:hypothetical protein
LSTVLPAVVAIVSVLPTAMSRVLAQLWSTITSSGPRPAMTASSPRFHLTL